MKVKIKDNYPVDEDMKPPTEVEIATRGRVLEVIAPPPFPWETELTWAKLNDEENICLYPEEFEVVEP